MKKIYLHIGTHKTGCTAIQHTLQNLQDRNILQENSFALVWKEVYSSLKTSWNKPHEAQSLDTFVAYIQKSIQETKANNIIISCEGFSSGKFLAQGNIQVLARALREYAVHICVYIRRQDHFVESGWAQGSKVFASVTEMKPWRPRWKELLDTYAQHFGKECITVRVYDRKILHMHDTRCDFLQWLGLQHLIPYLEKCYDNPSLSPANLRIRLSYMRQNTLSEEEKIQGMRDIQAQATQHPTGLPLDMQLTYDMLRRGVNADMPFCLTANHLLGLEKTPQRNTHAYMPLEERKEYLAQFTEENAAIAREYLGKEDGQLFDNAMPQERISLDSPSTDDLVTTFLPIFVHLAQKIETLEEKNILLTQKIEEFEKNNTVLSSPEK